MVTRARMAGLLMTVTTACVAVAGCSAPPPTATATSSSSSAAATAMACVVGVWSADTGQIQQFYESFTSTGDYPPVAVEPGSSFSFTFASEGMLNAFNFAASVPVTAMWDGAARTTTLGGQLWGTYSAAADTIKMTPLKDALTAANRDQSVGNEQFAAATKAKLAPAPISATTYRCEGNTLTLGVDADGRKATIKLTREKP